MPILDNQKDIKKHRSGGRRSRQRSSDALQKPLPTNAWQLVYTGFVLILLCFFIMLTSYASFEQAKVMQFTEAFSDAVNVFSGGQSLDKGKTVLPPSAEIVSKESPTARLIEEIAAFAGENDLSDVELRVDPKAVVMTLPDAALFDSGTARIKPTAAPTLMKIGRLIAQVHCEIRIAGHTDSKPIRTAQFPSNWELSSARAVNVLRFFLDQAGIPASRLSAAGYASFQPLSAEGLDARQRRVEITFLTHELEAGGAA
jgi:chemotaxis protein MotB